MEKFTTAINKCREEQLRCLEELNNNPPKDEIKGIKLGIFDWIMEEVIILHEHTSRDVLHTVVR